MSAKPINYIDRASGKLCTESVMGQGALNFAYNTLMGRCLWGMLFNTGLFSNAMGWYYDSKSSQKSIKSLLAIPGLNADEAEKEWNKYNSFNDFFTRKLKPGARPAAEGDNILCSPADGRLLVYNNVAGNIKLPVKGALRSLESLCQMKLAEKNYSVAVIRLAPIDYHRYHYPCACSDAGNSVKIKGKYHSVNPIAFQKAPDLFVENTRVVTPLYSPVFGNFYYLEIGAFGVGSIVNTAQAGKHEKLEEKGCFKFGGSTVILIMDANKVKFDDDIIQNSANKLETLVKCGEKIASVV